MNFYLSLSLLLFAFGVDFSLVGENDLHSSKQILSLKADINPLKETPAVNTQNIESGFSDAIPGNRKKRNKKGVKPALFCSTNESLYKKENFDHPIILSTPLPYYFSALSAIKKRGPPFTSNI